MCDPTVKTTSFLPHLAIRISGKESGKYACGNALVDTGAMVNVMPKYLADVVGGSGCVKSSDITLRGVSGGKMDSSNELQYEVRYTTDAGKTHAVTTSFLVVDSQGIIILGMPFLRDTESVMNIADNTMDMNGERVTLSKSYKSLRKC